MPRTCSIDGNADMYGLGIRVGYYLQWYGMLLAAWLCPDEVPGLRLSNTFFVASTFLALLTQVPKDGLEVVEIYIILLFTFGSSLYLIPVLLWRILTKCSVRWDPSRTPKARPPSKLYTVLNSSLQMAVLAFQIWFWVNKVESLKSRSCVAYGFLFSKVRLDMQGLKVLNIVLSAVLLFLLAFFLSMMPAPIRSQMDKILRIKKPSEEKMDPSLIKAFQTYDSITKFFVATTIVFATEFTIHWNGISSVNSISNVGQTIPLVIGIGSFLRVLYLFLKNRRAHKYHQVNKIDAEKADIAPVTTTTTTTDWWAIPETRIHWSQPPVPQAQPTTHWAQVPSEISSVAPTPQEPSPYAATGYGYGVSPMRAEELEVPESTPYGPVSPENPAGRPYGGSTATYPGSPEHYINQPYGQSMQGGYHVSPENSADQAGGYGVRPQDTPAVYHVSPENSEDRPSGQSAAKYIVSPEQSADAPYEPYRATRYQRGEMGGGKGKEAKRE